MSIKQKFVANNKKKPQIEEFLMKHFEKYGYSHSDIRKTHMGMDIIIYANKPGLIIGRGGENINDMSDRLKKEFNFENVRIDVQEVSNPYLNSKIVGEEIKSALERGLNVRKIGNIMLKKVIESGAVGCELRLAGKLGSAKARVQRFNSGYMKYSGDTAKKYVDYAKVSAITKAGKIGIKVRIMKEYPEAKIKEIKEVVIEKEPESLTCPYCGKVYDKERSLKIHIGQKHAEEEAGKKPDTKKTEAADKLKVPKEVEKTDKPEEKTPKEKPLPETEKKIEEKVEKNVDTEVQGNKKDE